MKTVFLISYMMVFLCLSKDVQIISHGGTAFTNIHFLNMQWSDSHHEIPLEISHCNPMCTSVTLNAATIYYIIFQISFATNLGNLIKSVRSSKPF